MQFLLFIHDNTRTTPSADEWTDFCDRAGASGLFRGGSEVGARQFLGRSDDVDSSDFIVGYMRFDADDKQPLLDLLATHPNVVHGGTVELCELPES
jgi:hypothetical protein